MNAECKERYAFFDDRHASRGRSPPHARLAAAPWLGARGEANGVGHVQWGLPRLTREARQARRLW